MTVATELHYVERNWTGVETVFSTGYTADADADVVVRARVSGETPTVLTRNVHYRVLRDGGGLVQIAPILFPPAPRVIEIERVTPALQPVRFLDGEDFPALVHERAHDRAAMRDAEFRGVASRLASLVAQIKALLGTVVVEGLLVPSRAYLVALPTLLPVGTLAVQTLGYAAPNVGPGAKYILLGGAPATPHAGHIQTAAGQWLEISGDEFTVAQLGGDITAAAQAAFRLNKPLIHKSGLGYLDINLTTEASADTPRARHAYLAQVIQWRATCTLGSLARLPIRLTGFGLHTVAAWDSLANFVPVHYWRLGSAGSLEIQGNNFTEHAIASITYGTRGTSDFSAVPAIVRGPNEYPVTVVFTAPLPEYVVKGYAIGMRNINGDNDAEALNGAIMVETISPDRTTVTSTVYCSRTADLVSPTTIITGSTYNYNGLNSSVGVVDQVCLGWDTDYTLGGTQAISGVTNFSAKTVTGLTNAIPGVVTAVAHGFSNGQIITMAGVVGMRDPDDVSGVNNISFVVTNATTDTFELWDLDGAQYDTTVLTAYTSGGTATRPTRLTVTGHPYINGQLVRVADVNGMTQLNNRQYRVATVQTNDFAILDMNSVGIDTTGYGAYSGGGTTQIVTEVWTGLADEGYFVANYGGTIEIRFLGVSYIGYLGTSMDQDTFMAWRGGRIFVGFHCVLARAGDKIIRAYDRGQIEVTSGCLGGGSTECIGPQGNSTANLVRSVFGGTYRATITVGDGTDVFLAGCIVASGWQGMNSTPGGRGTIANSKVSACIRAVYTTGGLLRFGTNVIFNRNGIGVDGVGPGQISGKPRANGARSISAVVVPTAGLGNVDTTPPGIDTPLTMNGVGVPASTRGGPRWTADLAANLSLGRATGLSFATDATPIDLDSSAATDAGSGVTMNKQAGTVTTQSLSTAAGASDTVVVTNSHATTTSIIVATRVGGTATAGTPQIRITRASGSFTITITNIHASAALNGTVAIAWVLFA